MFSSEILHAIRITCSGCRLKADCNDCANGSILHSEGELTVREEAACAAQAEAMQAALDARYESELEDEHADMCGCTACQAARINAWQRYAKAEAQGVLLHNDDCIPF